MTYYVVGGSDLQGTKKYLAYDIDEDKYYWVDTGMEYAVERFETIAIAQALLNSRPEFTLIVNTGIELLMPELLYLMSIPSIAIEQVIYFEPVQTVNFSAVITDYNNRKLLFDAKQKELESI